MLFKFISIIALDSPSFSVHTQGIVARYCCLYSWNVIYTRSAVQMEQLHYSKAAWPFSAQHTLNTKRIILHHFWPWQGEIKMNSYVNTLTTNGDKAIHIPLRKSQILHYEHEWQFLNTVPSHAWRWNDSLRSLSGWSNTTNSWAIIHVFHVLIFLWLSNTFVCQRQSGLESHNIHM